MVGNDRKMVGNDRKMTGNDRKMTGNDWKSGKNHWKWPGLIENSHKSDRILHRSWPDKTGERQPGQERTMTGNNGRATGNDRKNTGKWPGMTEKWPEMTRKWPRMIWKWRGMIWNDWKSGQNDREWLEIRTKVTGNDGEWMKNYQIVTWQDRGTVTVTGLNHDQSTPKNDLKKPVSDREWAENVRDLTGK